MQPESAAAALPLLGEELHAPPAIGDGASAQHDGGKQNAAMAAKPTSPARPSDRRSGRDRRQQDIPPPRGWERRRRVEPRRPEVVELELTPSQWDALHNGAFGAAAGPSGAKGAAEASPKDRALPDPIVP
jgi:hypothetical protein